MKIKWSLITGIIFIAYYLCLAIGVGATLINSIFLFVGLFFIGIYCLDLKYEKKRVKDTYLKWRGRALALFWIGTSFFVVVNGAMLIIAMDKNLERTDIVMVLGAGLEGDKVSPTLKTRLDGAIKYVKETGGQDFIIVSGGQGHDELISEAEAMRRYLVDAGIPNEQIILEDKSTSTYENFKFSKEIIETKTGKYIEDLDIKVFTNGFHCMRSYFLGKRLGYGELSTYGTSTPPSLTPYYYFREVFAFAKSIIFDKG
ncbi:MAG: YdcF family protein [Sarcina sp.]